jgi:hypothetical protein
LQISADGRAATRQFCDMSGSGASLGGDGLTDATKGKSCSDLKTTYTTGGFTFNVCRMYFLFD